MCVCMYVFCNGSMCSSVCECVRVVVVTVRLVLVLVVALLVEE